MYHKYVYSVARKKSTQFHPTVVVLLVVLMSLFCWDKAHAADWTDKEIAKELAFQGLNIADFYLTDRIMKDGGEEVGLMKAVIGSNPDTKTLTVTCVAVGIAHYIVTDILIDKKSKHTSIWQNISIGIKGVTVGFNYTQAF